MRIDLIKILRVLAGVAIVLLWAWLLTSCRAQSCLPQTITRDSLVTRYLHDSVYLYERDSIFVQQRADTVYLTRYITRYKDVFQVRHDTIVDTRHEVQVQRERYVPKYYSVVSWGFWILVVLIAGITAIRILTKIYLRR